MRQPYFEAQWDFASTVPGAEQPGLSVVASPDRGDGARMSWVQMADTPTGLEVNFYDYQSGVNEVGCGTGSNFIETNVASGLSRTAPHTIKVTSQFVNGTNNDIVKVYVDGVLMHIGTSWEGYFNECELNPTRTVDSILFRTGGTAHPANAGKGFVIDNMTLTSGPVPAATPNPNAVGGFVDVFSSGTESGSATGLSGLGLLAITVAITAVTGSALWVLFRRRS